MILLMAMFVFLFGSKFDAKDGKISPSKTGSRMKQIICTLGLASPWGHVSWKGGIFPLGQICSPLIVLAVQNVALWNVEGKL